MATDKEHAQNYLREAESGPFGAQIPSMTTRLRPQHDAEGTMQIYELVYLHSLWVRYPEARFGLVDERGLSVDCMRLERVRRGLSNASGLAPRIFTLRVGCDDAGRACIKLVRQIWSDFGRSVQSVSPTCEPPCTQCSGVCATTGGQFIAAQPFRELRR